MSDAPLVRSPAEAVAAARGRDGWVWLADGSADTSPAALEPLLAAAALVPDAALLASAVVSADGRPAADHAPLLPRAPDLLALDTAVHRVLHVRATTGASVLVRARVAAATPAPGGSGTVAALAWTARILRETVGYLVPASTVTATTSTPFARRTAALLFADGLQRGERLRLALDAAERIFRAA